MEWWREQVVPRIVDRALAVDAVEELRSRVCRGLTGSVLEIGFGSGRNLPHYPAAVAQVYAVEPSEVGWRLAQPRIQASPVPIRRVGLDGARIALPDESVDHAVSTFTLCTIRDVRGALAELRRILRPGGTFSFAEHGRSPEPSVQRWQDRLDGLNAAVFGGCHLTRPIEALIGESGLRVTTVEKKYAPGPKPFGYLFVGVATAL